ncbi:MAG: hypothetical protein AAB590_04010 [Patescibacteria group bacterium]
MNTQSDLKTQINGVDEQVIKLDSEIETTQGELAGMKQLVMQTEEQLSSMHTSKESLLREREDLLEQLEMLRVAQAVERLEDALGRTPRPLRAHALEKIEAFTVRLSSLGEIQNPNESQPELDPPPGPGGSILLEGDVVAPGETSPASPPSIVMRKVEMEKPPGFIARLVRRGEQPTPA